MKSEGFGRVGLAALVVVNLALLQPSAAVIDPLSWGVAAAAGGMALAGMYAGVERLRCHWKECCTSDWIKPNMIGLESALTNKLHGQHLVQDIVVKVLRRHVSRQNPTKALVMAFHGWTGGGKNFVSNIIAEHLYKQGMSSNFVHLFIATRHFMHEDLAETYKADLQNWIRGNISQCEQSLFIFDEVDKMPPGVIEAIVPFVDFHENVDGCDCRRAIFILISNTGGVDINNLCYEHWNSGKKRESIEMHDIEALVSQGAFNEQGGLRQSYLLQKHLVDHYVPFLPLERKHVQKCIEDELRLRGVEPSSQIINAVDRGLIYGPPSVSVFSATGCKRVSALLDRVLDN